MKTHSFYVRRSRKYTVSLSMTEIGDRFGHSKVAYTLTAPDGHIVFSGSDFGIPSGSDCESREAARSLLSFLTLRPGDTEDDYFETYTPEQMAWCQSSDCEELSYYTEED